MAALLLLASFEPQLEPGWPVSFYLSHSFAPGAYQGKWIYHIVPKTTTPQMLFWKLNGQEEGNWLKVWKIERKTFEDFRIFPVWDLDSDGEPEMFALKDTFWVLLDPTSGETEAVKSHWTDAFFFWSPPALFDADGDGAPEVYWMEGFDVDASRALREVRVYKFEEGRVDSTVFTAEGVDLSHKIIVNSFSVRLPIGDLDGDGEAELLVLLADSGKTRLVLVDALRLQAEGTASLGGEVYYWPVVADFDGDGISEALLVTHTADSCLLQVVSLGSLSPVAELSVPMERFRSGVWNPLLLADVNGDGRPEIVFLWETNTEDFKATLWISAYDCRLNLLKSDSFRIEGNTEAFAVSGDLDGDGTTF